MLLSTLPAATVPADGRIVYTPEAFAAYAPTTALDMASHVPGFRIQDGEDRRGYSGALGNVLIDGVHPNSKTETLEDALKRIPARQVQRIEVWRDGDAGAGGATPTLMINIVRVPAVAGGVWSAGTEIANSGQPAANGYVAVSGRYRLLDYSLGVSTYALRRDLPGDRTVSDADARPIAHIVDVSPRVFSQGALNGEVSYPAGGGKLKLNGALFSSRYGDRTEALTYTPALGQDDRTPYAESHRTAELGLNFERPLWGGDLTLAALTTRKRFASAVVADTLGPSGQLWSRFTQTLRHDSGEDIVRAAFGRRIGAHHHLDAGAEMARNSLTARTLDSLDLGAGPQPLVLHNANIRIVERRAEAFISDSWTAAPSWTLEARLAYETSRLDFSGDTRATVTLGYLKPSVQISHTFGRNQLRLKIARDVGQLNFEDFTTAASAADKRINGGNPNLRPQTTWRYEVALDTRFGRTSAVSARVFRDAISDAADLVPVSAGGSTYDAPGNIGHASVMGVQLTAHLPVSTWRGAAFDLDATFRHSSATDPTTGERRRLSNLADTSMIAHFRHDIPDTPYAWGVDYTFVSATWRYYAAEVYRHRDSPSLDVFGEVRLPHSLKLQAYVKSALGSPELRTRTFYFDRPAGRVDRVEARRYLPGRWLYVTLSGTF